MGFTERSAMCKHCNDRVLARKKTPNHILHLLLTFLFCGTWLIVWAIMILHSAMARYRCTRCGALIAVLLAFSLSGCATAIRKSDLPQATRGEVMHALYDLQKSNVVGIGEFGTTSAYRDALTERGIQTCTLSPEEQDAVRRHEIFQGMSRDALVLSWGYPTSSTITKTPMGKSQHCCYGINTVTLQDDHVSWWHIEGR